MDYDNLLSDLRSGVVEVFFRKQDGSVRRMRCTLVRSLIPDAQSTVGAPLTLDEMIGQYGTDVEKWWAATERGDLNSYPFKDILFAIFSAHRLAEKEPQKSFLKVYDLEVRGWRSFVIDRVISSQFVETA